MSAEAIVGIGIVGIDHVVVLSDYPERDTKCQAEDQWRQIGGPVPVALSTAVFYGAKASFLGRWGNDPAGQEITDGLASRGIDLAPCHSESTWSTGFSHVWIDRTHGSRTVASYRGQFAPLTSNDVIDNTNIFDACGVLHLDGSFPSAAIAAARAVKSRHGIVVLDAGSKKSGMEELIPHVDVLVASNLFARSWYGAIDVSANSMRHLGCGAVVRTRGNQGIEYADGNLHFHHPAVSVDVVDTNGAGDIFSGAMLYALSRRWDVRRSVRFANAVAGLSCARRGNSAWPDQAELVNYVDME